MNSRGTVRLLTLASLGCALAACASTSVDASDDGQVRDSTADISLAQMTSEYRSEIGSLEFPEGWVDPGPGDWETETGKNGEMITHVFESFYGEVTAQARWVCAWQAFWVDSGGSEDATDEVIDKLADLDQMMYWEYSDEATKERRQEILESIRGGRIDEVAQETQLNCATA